VVSPCLYDRLSVLVRGPGFRRAATRPRGPDVQPTCLALKCVFLARFRKSLFMLLLVAVALGAVVAFSSCASWSGLSSSRGSSGSGGSTAGARGGARIREFYKIWPDQLRVRRPPGTVVSPRAEPGGLDYRRQELPAAFPAPQGAALQNEGKTERWDCEPWTSLVEALDAEALVSCLGGTAAGSAVYRLRREAQPYLELMEVDGASVAAAISGRGGTPGGGPAAVGPRGSCLTKLLPRVAVPREVWFRHPVADGVECQSARLHVEADSLLGAKLPVARWELEVRFPLPKPPSKAEEVRRLIAAWALTPFFRDRATVGRASEEDGDFLVATYLPRAFCQKCWGGQPPEAGGPRWDAPLFPP
jgi:hypothetical protein